jgi:hypothetical protein
MNELLTKLEMEHLKAENERLREALAKLEKTLVWVTEQLKELTK